MSEPRSAAATETVSIVVCSDDASTRREVLAAVGRRAGRGLPEISWKETATPDALLHEVRQGDYDLMILDAESPKLGGMGLGKMVHDEIDPDIPFVLLIARPQDEWLARWSGARKIVSYPINPRELSSVVADILEG
ncbi:MAG: hypothetical protein Q3979_06645 [Actinomycetaceae bacterium]|nr:hypothetical protein [Actinomycetaceae bacterium]